MNPLEHPSSLSSSLFHSGDLNVPGLTDSKSLRRDKVNALTPEKRQAEMDNAKAYFDEVASKLKPEAGPWLFGQRNPTELDAHLVVMIARLQDVGHHDLISKSLKEYADTAYATPEWKEIMQDRTTMYDGSGKK